MEMPSSRHLILLVTVAALFFGIDMWGHLGDAYQTVWWVDIANHFLFGAWFTLLILYPKFWFYNKNPLFILLVVTTAGLGWETVEYLYDLLYAIPNGTNLAQHGVIDTVADIINNTLGAAAALLWVKFFK